MRLISQELQDSLNSGCTTMCRCWIVTRKDGLRLGFTDHDGDLVIDGVVCASGAALDAGAVQSATGLSVDNGQVRGALQSENISAADIRAGRYDQAEVRHYLVDWRRPEAHVMLFRGYLGEIRHGPAAFEAELRGLSAALNNPVGRVYLRQCDAVLGDGRCGFDLGAAGFVAEALVLAAEQRHLLVAVTSDRPAGWFARGSVHFGQGVRMDVVADTLAAAGQRNLGLWREPEFPVVPGDVVSLQAGCDRTAETCRNKFNNFINFRGFPHLPGDDWVTAYPGQGDRLDGSSMNDG